MMTKAVHPRTRPVEWPTIMQRTKQLRPSPLPITLASLLWPLISVIYIFGTGLIKLIEKPIAIGRFSPEGICCPYFYGVNGRNGPTRGVIVERGWSPITNEAWTRNWRAQSLMDVACIIQTHGCPELFFRTGKYIVGDNLPHRTSRIVNQHDLGWTFGVRHPQRKGVALI